MSQVYVVLHEPPGRAWELLYAGTCLQDAAKLLAEPTAGPTLIELWVDGVYVRQVGPEEVLFTNNDDCYLRGDK